MTVKKNDFVVEANVGAADAATWRRRGGGACPIPGKPTRRECLSWLETN